MEDAPGDSSFENSDLDTQSALVEALLSPFGLACPLPGPYSQKSRRATLEKSQQQSAR